MRILPFALSLALAACVAADPRSTERADCGGPGVPIKILLQDNQDGPVESLQDPVSITDSTWMVAADPRDSTLRVAMFLPARSTDGLEFVRVSARGVSAPGPFTTVLLSLHQGEERIAETTFLVQATAVQIARLQFEAEDVDRCLPVEFEVRSAVANSSGGTGPAVDVGSIAHSREW